MLPLSFYFWHVQKDNLHFLHSGQILLRKVMWFELAYVLLATVIMLFGESQNVSVWDVEAADIYLLILCVNSTQMLLHYALGAQEKFSDKDSHMGTALTDKKATIVIILAFFVMTILAWIYIGISMMSATSWTDPTNAGLFAFFHDMQTLRGINYFVYGLCALVQGIKIIDFYKHFLNNKQEQTDTHSVHSEEFDSSVDKKSHAKMSLINMGLAILGFCLIVIDMILLARYPGVANIMFNCYFILAVFVQVPMLHFMIVKQENK